MKLTPNSEPALSLLAKGALGPADTFAGFGAPGPVGGACEGGFEGPVREPSEPLAPVLAAAVGGGDCAFRSSGFGPNGGAVEEVVPSDVCRLRVAGGKACEGGCCCDGGGGGGAFFDLDLNRNDMACCDDRTGFRTDLRGSERSRRLRG